MPAQTVIKIRRDEKVNWETVNPVLSAGEIGYDSTSSLFKVGDGTSLWTELSYISDITASATPHPFSMIG
jgi:hypothetical protein